MAHPLPDNLPAPPIDADVDLRDYPSMLLDVVRLRDSDLAAVPDAEVFRANVLSWCASWHQIPAGSLPDDDPALARLLGYGRDVKSWAKLREAGALRGWVKCSDGRLYHPVVVEKAQEAWDGRKEASKRGKAGAAKRWARQHGVNGGGQNEQAMPTPSDGDSGSKALASSPPYINSAASTGGGNGTGTPSANAEAMLENGKGREGKGSKGNPPIRPQSEKERASRNDDTPREPTHMDLHALCKRGDSMPDRLRIEWQAAIEQGAAPLKVIEAYRAYLALPAVAGSQFIKKPETWLRDGGWKVPANGAAVAVFDPAARAKLLADKARSGNWQWDLDWVPKYGPPPTQAEREEAIDRHLEPPAHLVRTPAVKQPAGPKGPGVS